MGLAIIRALVDELELDAGSEGRGSRGAASPSGLGDR